MSELICPKSGNPCNYLSFCASRKEALEEGGDTATALAAYLPEPAATALSEAGFCADQCIEALTDVVDAEGVSREAASEATLMASKLLVARDMFPTPDARPTT